MAEREGANSGLILAAVLLLVAVCGFLWFFLLGSGEAQVSGTVLFNDQPLAGAQVIFLGQDEGNQAPLVTQSIEDGSYRLIGHKGGGIAPGKYKVVVSKMAAKAGTATPKGEALEQARTEGLLENVLPKIYEDLATTPLAYEIQPGNNIVILEVKKLP